VESSEDFISSSTYNLPERDLDIWRPLLFPNNLSPNYLVSADQPTVEMAVRQLVTIKSRLRMSTFCPSPVNKENRSSWTDQERQKATKAIKVINLCDIQPKVHYFLSDPQSSAQILI
jgi:hypothetical protein